MTPERYTANLSGFRYRVISRDGDEVTIVCETNRKERTVDSFILRTMFTPVTDNAVDSRACKVKGKSV